MRKYRVGVLGLDHWYWATSLIPQILKHPRYSLAAIHEPKAWRLKAVKYPARVVPRPQDITDAPDIDVVASFLPCPASAKWLARAAAKGKAVICNKPLAMDVAAAAPLLGALKRTRRPSLCLEGTAPLSARTRFLRSLVRKGVIGRPLTVTSVMRGGMPMAWWDRGGKSGRANWGWWTDARAVPGGAWLDHSIYAISEYRFILGDEPRSVTAVMANLKYPRSVLPLEDYGIATYKYRKGAVVTLEYDWIGGTGSHSLLVGTSGTLRWGGAVPHGTVELVARWKTRALKVPARLEERLLDHFASCLDRGRETVQPARLGAENLRLALLAYRASRLGRELRA
jgi:predicted dehydrogenase